MPSERLLQVFLPKILCDDLHDWHVRLVSRFYTNRVSTISEFLHLGPKSHKNVIRIGIGMKIKQIEVERDENWPTCTSHTLPHTQGSSTCEYHAWRVFYRRGSLDQILGRMAGLVDSVSFNLRVESGLVLVGGSVQVEPCWLEQISATTCLRPGGCRPSLCLKRVLYLTRHVSPLAGCVFFFHFSHFYIF